MHARPLNYSLRLLPILLLLTLPTQRTWAAQLVWTNTAGGNWTNAANWDLGAVPTLTDSAVITNVGTYAVTINSAASVASLVMGYADTNFTGIRTLNLTAGSLTLTNAAIETNGVLNFSGGTLTVRGLATAKGDFTWTAGTINGGGELQAGSANGVTTISTAGAKTLSGVTLGNFSTAAIWSGANWTLGTGATFYNSGNLTLTNDQTFAGGATVRFDNYGVFSKTVGTGQFLLSFVRFRNSGTVNINSGVLALTAITATNTGSLNLGAASQMLFNSGTLQLGGAVSAPTANSLQFIGGTATITSSSITSPSIWIAGATVQQQSAISVPAVNQSSGTYQLSLACNVGTYNLTNGILQGGTLTVTNFAWTDGTLYASTNGDKLIIPTNGVFNLLGSGEKSLFYNAPANLGYGIDNYGTWNWSGACILRGFGSTVNNYGTVSMTAPTLTYYSYYSGSYPTPTWNNFGTFTKTNGLGTFSFNGSIVNNTGTLSVQSGTCTFESSTKFTNSAAITVGATALLLNDTASETTYLPASTLTAGTANSVRIPSGTVYLQSANIATPALWINGGTLYQQAPNVVGTINQTAGYWWLNLATAVNTYNLTNGILRGGTLTVTNFTWTDGGLYANTNGDKLIIPATGVFNLLGAGEKSLFYYAPATLGYGIDNFGTWNWSGACILRGFGSTVNNYGTVNMTAPTLTYYSYYSGSYPTPTWNNFGTFTKSAGAGVFSFNGIYLNNSGNISAQTGTLAISSSTFANNGTIAATGTLLQFYGGTGTNYASINLGAATPMTVDGGAAVTFAPAGALSAPTLNSVQIISGSLVAGSTNLNTPSLWINGGTLYQQTNIAVATINMSGGALQLEVPAFLNQLNQTNGDVQGRSLTITNWNWIAGHHYRGNTSSNTVDDRTIIPPGGVMNFPGTANRNLSYLVNPGPGRTLDNFGSVNWTGAAVISSYGAFNNYGSVNVSAVGTAQYYSPTLSVPSTWNNYGTFTRSAGTLFYFQGGYVNNSGLMDLQQGTLDIYNATLTNSTGVVNIGGSGIFQSEASSVVVLGAASRLTATTADSIRLGGASAAIETTNIVSPTIWLQAGTLYQRTNIVVATINETGGALQLEVPAFLNQLNQTNGDVQGRSLTITNWNWIAGHHYRGNTSSNTVDDRTIIPPGGVMNLIGTTTRNLSYLVNPGPGRTLDNFGTVNWSGNAVLGSYGAFNNYGSVNVSAVGTPQYYSPTLSVPSTWNNYGTFTRSAGTLFYFQGGYVNNSGLMDIQQGTLSIYNATFTNLSGGNMLAQLNGVIANDVSSLSFFEAGSSLGCAATNAFQINSGTVTLRTANITAPSLWINGGTLNQNTNVAVPVINESAGTWQLNVPASLATYNLTNGDLRGANLTLNNFNWLGGVLYAAGSGSNLVTVSSQLYIGSATAKTMTYFTALPGRSLINNGTAIWGGGNITGQGTSLFQNNGTLTLTNDVGFSYGGSGGACVFQNTSTFTKSAGSGVATFSGTIVTNSGTLAINSGGITIGGLFVQTAGSAFLGTNFSASSDVRILAGSLSGKGSVTGYLYNNASLNPGASPGFINGNNFTNTAAATYNIEIGGNTGAGTNYDQLRFTGPVTLDGTLNVSLYNNYALLLSNRFTVLTTSARTGTFASVIPPPGATLNTIYSPTNVILEVVGLTNAPLQILTNPISQTLWTPDPVTFSAAVSGVTPITFQWQFNGNNISGATNASYTIPTIVVTNAGLYTLQITDGTSATTNTSATLTVIPFGNTIWWTNTLGGNWSAPTNWLPNRVPNGTNNVVIVSNGTYTVTVDVPAALSNLIVGAIGATGTPTVHLVYGQSLAVNGNTTWETNSVLALNGLLQMAGGSNNVRGHLDWQLGTLAGRGRTVIASNASLTFYGSLNQKFIATNILENYGTFTYGNDSFGNAQGLRFSGGAQLTNYPSGVINIGTAAYDYSGSQTPRSYLVNYGTINAGSSSVFSPTYISIDFINYGLLYDFGYIYLGRGTNYGTFQYFNTFCEVSVFGDETSGEYFSFEDGTVFTGTFPKLAVGGYAQWNTTAVHPGRLIVISGSGGASFANPEFRVLKNYTQTGSTIVQKGRWTQANPALTADLNDFSDSVLSSAYTFVITNAGTLRANTFSHNVRNLFNSGSITVRSNLTLSGSSYTYGGGTIVITNNANATFAGGTVEAQTVLNRGTNSVTGAMAFIGGTYYRNFAGTRTYFAGGSFVTGPASLLNEGLLDGFGGLAITVTNRANVLANDVLGRNLALGNYVQESGLTSLTPGSASGDLNILGGLLTGAGNVTGNVRNAATIAPGKPFGLLSVTGNFTNTAAATYFLPINGVTPGTNFPQTRVSGTSVLGGTLYVNFTNGFNPAPGNLFTAMVFTARSGVFDAIVNDTYGLEAFYTATTLVLRAENILPVMSLTVVGGNNQLVCTPIKVRASGSDADGAVTNMEILLNGITASSRAGTNVTNLAEADFAQLLTFVARGRDDRGGYGYATQQVSVLNYSLTNLLFLGGVRTNDFKVCMVGEPGRDYEIFGTTDLTQTNWLDLGPMVATNGTWHFTDPNTVAQRAHRLYRAKQLGSSSADTQRYQIGIQRGNSLNVLLVWPTNAVGWLLESTGTLPATNWIPVVNVPSIVGTNYSVSLPMIGTQQYFRLHKP